MVKREGDRVEKGEVLAENKPLIKWFKSTVTSPITGTVETISNSTGQVLLRDRRGAWTFSAMWTADY